MTDRDETHLPGLIGDNPMGFLAALGTQAALAEAGNPRKLSWTHDVTPHAVLTPALDISDVVAAATTAVSALLAGTALPDERAPKAHQTLKFKEADLQAYLQRCREAGGWSQVAFSLVAEGSLDNSDNAKPADIYFHAGQQVFAGIARAILLEAQQAASGSGPTKLERDVAEPWRYADDDKAVGTMLWDATDDAHHALMASDPAPTPKELNHGAEALALLGLRHYPCFGCLTRTRSPGFAGNWKTGGTFTWPLWDVPASSWAVHSLLAAVDTTDEAESRRREWYEPWGFFHVYRSTITRSDQGGYGTFRPPVSAWSRDLETAASQ